MPAVAVTDHGNLFAAANFFHEATTHGVKPIIGCEVYVAPDSHKIAEAPRRSARIISCCSAKTTKATRNLIKLVSTGFLDGFYYKPRIDHDLLAKHSRGLIALSACLRGEVTEARAEGKLRQGRASRPIACRIFSAKAISSSKCRTRASKSRQRVNRDLVRLSRETGIPLVATNDCHYLTQSDARAQEVLMCIQTGKTMSDTNRMKFRHRPVLFQDRRRNGAGFPRNAGRARAHGGDRRALQCKN